MAPTHAGYVLRVGEHRLIVIGAALTAVVTIATVGAVLMGTSGPYRVPDPQPTPSIGLTAPATPLPPIVPPPLGAE